MRWIADPKHGDLINATDTMYPTMLEVLTGEGSESGRITIGNHHSTAYGVVLSGMIGLDGMPALHGSVLSLNAGSYFSFPGTFNIDLVGDSKVALITRYGFRGQVVSGRLEQRGRLSYIDGCSDSMLVYPPRKGDPVLNHLHFPGNILQTQHTHPSIRMGVVMSGEGVSWRGEHGSKEDLRPFMALAEMHGLEYAVAYYEAWKDGKGGETQMGHIEIEFEVGGQRMAHAGSAEQHADLFSGVDMLYHLRAGGVFMLEESELHSFATVPGQNMEIVAYHPDSDWGPTDEDHPMLNRTFINHGQ